MGDARRRKLSGLSRLQLKPGQDSPPLRSPRELEAEAKFDDQQQTIIAASLDFLYSASEDALRQQTRRILALHSKAPCAEKSQASQSA